MLVPMIDLLKPARAEGYAVGSFDVNDLETAVGVLEAAVEKRSPVIIAVPEFGPGAPLSMETLFRHVADYSRDLPVPVAIILDHGRSVDAVVRAIRSGATAVMLDASTKSDAENIALTKLAAQIGHWAGVTVEGEIGHVGQGTDYGKIDTDLAKLFTQPEQAVRFVEETGVDALAVAVGTAHGSYSGTPRLDFERLAQLREVVSVPLVLHGGSSSGDANLHRASTMGVAKVNIYTDMAVAARERMAKLFAGDTSRLGIGTILNEMKLGFKEVAGHYMDVFGSTGRAMIASGKQLERLAASDSDA
jgi:fructose-bisphosphate aldolase, class II